MRCGSYCNLEKKRKELVFDLRHLEGNLPGLELRMAQPKLLHFMLLCLLYMAHAGLSSGETKVTRAVKEAVTFPCNYEIPEKERTYYRVYWQHDTKVVQAYVPGRRGEDLIDLSYVNRTVMEMANNLSVTIFPLQVPDEGTYECIVQRLVGGQYKRVHKQDVQLSISADFPEPTTEVYEETGYWRMTCSSRQGYPQPKLSWVNNGKVLTSVNTSIFQDPVTKLYDIQSELHINQTTIPFYMLNRLWDSRVSANVTLPKGPDSWSGALIIAATLPSIFFLIAMILLVYQCFYKHSEGGLYSPPQELTSVTTTEEGNGTESPVAHVNSATTSSGRAASV
ncbi:T-lymphocyte activation antigen CD80 [Monodelphis domestica]|uniref:T-lymphocyte activation antigen CD80 n=1 Tax=Monodelphis domestica TaxID=13616 RepID=UPI0024E1C246|nr:T-lymphocyte activation antigen CD80 [Monodelphis domestica]XP_056649474.1 T-lymphocyte activation antigen CD80 [Monodelphis domestica]